MIQQVEITLTPKSRGFHLVTGEIHAPLAYAASPYGGDAQICFNRTNGAHLRLVPGIYFCEYRNYGGARKLVITIIGE